VADGKQTMTLSVTAKKVLDFCFMGDILGHMIELDKLFPPGLKRQIKVEVDGEKRWMWVKESTYQKIQMLTANKKSEK
jgi:hypothetical protein